VHLQLYHRFAYVIGEPLWKRKDVTAQLPAGQGRYNRRHQPLPNQAYAYNFCASPPRIALNGPDQKSIRHREPPPAKTMPACLAIYKYTDRAPDMKPYGHPSNSGLAVQEPRDGSGHERNRAIRCACEP